MLEGLALLTHACRNRCWYLHVQCELAIALARACSDNPHGLRLQKFERWLALCFLQCVDETFAKSRNFMAAIHAKKDAQVIRMSGIRLFSEASAYVVVKRQLREQAKGDGGGVAEGVEQRGGGRRGGEHDADDESDEVSDVLWWRHR